MPPAENRQRMKVITGRTEEVTIIAAQIPGCDDMLLGRSACQKYWVVKTARGIERMTGAEIAEIYGLDVEGSNLERLGWAS